MLEFVRTKANKRENPYLICYYVSHMMKSELWAIFQYFWRQCPPVNAQCGGGIVVAFCFLVPEVTEFASKASKLSDRHHNGNTDCPIKPTLLLCIFELLVWKKPKLCAYPFTLHFQTIEVFKSIQNKYSIQWQ